MLYSALPPAIHIQQLDLRIARTTCENLIPKTGVFIKNVKETFVENKLFVILEDGPKLTQVLNVKPKYLNSIWLRVYQKDGSVDIQACIKNEATPAKWVKIESYSAEEWDNLLD